jgi:hypothetical protein
MSRVITIDATELNVAAPRIGALYATLAMSARQLRAVDTSCEMPPGVAGRVTAGVSAAAAELAGAERTMDGMDGEIRKRAHLAQIADAVGKVTFGLGTIKLPADLIDAARSADEEAGAAARVSARAGGIAYAVKGLLGAVSTAADVYGVLATAANPYLDDNRKSAEAIAKGATVSGTLLVTGVAVGVAGVALVSLPAVAIGVGVGVTYTLLDKKFHITSTVADGVNSALDAAADGVDAAGDAIDDVGDALGDAGDKAKDFVGGLL